MLFSLLLSFITLSVSYCFFIGKVFRDILSDFLFKNHSEIGGIGKSTLFSNAFCDETPRIGQKHTLLHR